MERRIVMQRLERVGYIVPKNSSEVKNSRIGIGFEKLDRDVFDPEKAYDKVAQLGIKWVRIQSGWAKTEKQKGVFDFAWLDKIVDNLVSRGLTPWICLCYGNGIYDDNAAKVFGAVGVPPIFTDEQKKAWENYVKALVNRYKDRVSHYEVWNEPDGIWCWKHGVNACELGAFNADTARYVHQVYPKAEVIGIVHCLSDLKFVNDALSLSDAAKHLDAVSFHEYTHDERYIVNRVQSLRAVCDKYKKGMKIIQGESGSQSRYGANGALNGMMWTPLSQSKQLARHTVLDLSTEVEFTSYFSCMDMVEALNGTEGDVSTYLDYGYFGVLGADFDKNGVSVGTYTPKLSYYALQTIAAVFSEDYTVSQNLPILFKPSYSQYYGENDCTGLELTTVMFERQNGSKCIVMWNPTNILTTDWHGSVSFQLLSETDNIHLVNLLNGEVYKMPWDMICDLGNGVYEISHMPVSDSPMALVLGDFCQWSK